MTNVDPSSVALDRFENFFRSEYAKAFQFACLVLGSRGEADDVVQDAFLAIRPRFADLDNPSAYLRTVIGRRAINHHRTLRRRSRLLPTLYTDLVAEPLELPNPALLQAMGRLPIRQRTVLVLRFWSDLDYQGIADALGWPIGTVRSTLARALDNLRLTQKGQPR